jgi:uncharacterized protein (DUF4415 family)
MAKLKPKPPRYGTPDEDIPEMTLEDFRRARPFKEVFPELYKRLRGRPKLANPKQHVSLRLDPEVLAGFKAQGPGWQGKINDVLAEALAKRGKPKSPRAGRTRRAA